MANEQVAIIAYGPLNGPEEMFTWEGKEEDGVRWLRLSFDLTDRQTTEDDYKFEITVRRLPMEESKASKKEGK